MSKITGYCHIKSDAAYLNGRKLLENDLTSEDKWLKQIYKYLKISYPKFYKMDQLAQAGFLAFEMLRSDNERITKYGEDEVAIIFANASSSSVTDLRFQESYVVNETPSPSLFVYTLPNIVIGELAILNKWYGENMFAVLPNFAPDFYINSAKTLFADEAAKAMLGGWIEVSEKDFEVFLFFVESDSENGVDFSVDELKGHFENL